MKHSINKISDTQQQITITLSAADLQPIKQKTLQRLAKQVKVAGFRQGNVPLPLVEKNIAPNILSTELLEDAINSSALEVFEAERVVPLDQPKVEVKKFVPGQELEYTATVESIPKIKLGNYKNLKAKKEKVSVGEADVAEVIERLRTTGATKKDVGRVAKSGDEVIIDFIGTDKDGKEVAGATGKDYPLVLGSNSLIPGFEDGLIGKKAGDKVKLKLTFPKDYHHKPLAGAVVNFAVDIKAVKEVNLPALNDAFAAKSGPFKTVKELKADIRRELSEQKEREALDKLKDSLIEQLVKASDIPTPEVLVNDQMASLERDFTQNLLYRGMTLDQYLKQQNLTKEDWQKGELREQAVRRVKVGLALSELSKLEDIQVTQTELEERLANMLKQYGGNPEIAKQLDTPEARRDIANRELTQKTVDKLVELNQS